MTKRSTLHSPPKSRAACLAPSSTPRTTPSTTRKTMTTTRTSSSDRALSRMPRKIRIASRPSKLALAQASIVRERLTKEVPGIEIEIVEIRTSGDKMTSASLADVGGKGLLIKELEQALAARTSHGVFHSRKDLPAILPQQFRVAAVLERENTADILVT